MSEKKVLNDDELNKVAGGTYEEDGTTEKLYVGAHVEIYYEWLAWTRSFGGEITEISKDLYGVWNYYINMEDSKYTGWYGKAAIEKTHSDNDSVLLSRVINLNAVE